MEFKSGEGEPLTLPFASLWAPCLSKAVYCCGVFRDIRLAYERQAGCRRRDRWPLSFESCEGAGSPSAFHDPDGCRDVEVRSHKDGSMEQGQSNTKIAGIDVGKRQLDVAVYGHCDERQAANTTAGISELVAWLKAREVGRVGMEATGGYERAVRLALEAAGFEVVVHQPIEVRIFAKLKRRRAKNDKLDARLIAAATAQVDTVRAAQDPRLAELAERLTAYEQITDLAAAMKTALEHVTLKDIGRLMRVQIQSLERLKAKLAAQVIGTIKAHADLLARFRLLTSLPGVGPIVAATPVS